MIAGLIGAVLVAGLGALFVWLGQRMEDGTLNPNMGHHNAHNTTPASWRTMQLTVGRSIISCGRTWLVGAVAMVFFAPLGVALIVISTGVLVVQLAMAATRLESAA